jgi:hypothetical protein
MWENVVVVSKVFGVLFLFVLVSAIVCWGLICLTASVWELKKDDEEMNEFKRNNQ